MAPRASVASRWIPHTLQYKIEYNNPFYTNKMLFQSDYWMAENPTQKSETIHDFLLTDEGIKTLVIIDISGLDILNLIANIVKYNDIECEVIVNKEEREIYNYGEENPHKKTIYIRKTLEEALQLLRSLQPILAIFT